VRSADIIIIGGGLSGSAIALGLIGEGIGKVILFDEQLPTQRLSRGNFGLTWFMCKGATHPIYAQWSRLACEHWPDFAALLEEESGYNIELEWTGGAVHAIGDEEFKVYTESIEGLTSVCAQVGLDYPVRMLDRQEFSELIPKIELGPEVSGAMYPPSRVTSIPSSSWRQCAPLSKKEKVKKIVWPEMRQDIGVTFDEVVH